MYLFPSVLLSVPFVFCLQADPMYAYLDYGGLHVVLWTSLLAWISVERRWYINILDVTDQSACQYDIC